MSITHPIDLEIRHDIEARLSAIEPVQNVRVFSASKSGSLGWVFASPDSDYAVRFIYVYPESGDLD